VLMYTFIFSCARLPGRKIKCVYENWISYDKCTLRSRTRLCACDQLLITPANGADEKLNVYMRTGSIMTVYTAISDAPLCL